MEISQCPQNLKIYMSFDPVFPLLVILEHISKGMVIRMFTEVLFSIAKTNKNQIHMHQEGHATPITLCSARQLVETVK